MKSRMKIQTNHIKYGYYKRKHRLTLNIYHLEQTSQTESKIRRILTDTTFLALTNKDIP